MITLIRNGLSLNISEDIIPAQGSSNVPIKYIDDSDTYQGFIPQITVGWVDGNGLPHAVLMDIDAQGNYLIPSDAFKLEGFIYFSVGLVDSNNPRHIEKTIRTQAFSSPAPTGTVILPSEAEWQELVKNYMDSLFDINYGPNFSQIQQDLESLVTEAEKQQEKSNQQQTQIDDAINVMGEYEIVSEDPVQIRFKKGDGTYGNLVDLGDGLASKATVFSGYYLNDKNYYNGISSNDGINIGKIIGKSFQNGTPTPDEPVEIENVKITKLTSHSRNLFDASKLPTKSQGGATVTNNGDGSFTVSGSGTLSSSFSVQYLYSHEDTIKLLKAGKLMCYFDSQTTPFIQIYLRNGSGSFNSYTNKNGTGTFTTEVLQEILNDPNMQLLIAFYAPTGETIKPGTIKPVVYQDGDGTWEPFNFSEVETDITLAEDDVYENDTIQRKRKQVVFDGSSDENWIWSASNGIPYIQLQDAKPSSLPKCNKVKSYIVTGTNYQEGITINGTGKLSVNITDEMYPNKNWNDAETWKTWLKSNPITVEYELATPITEYVDVPTIPSYYPNTVASHNSVVEPTEIEWHVNTDGVTTVTGANNEPLKEVPMTPPQDELVNSDFQINQRGQASYNFNTNGKYGLDCWQHRQGAYYGAIVVEPLEGGGIKTTLNSQTGAGIRQYVKRDSSVIGKKRTTLIKVDDIECTGTVTLSESVQSIVENDIFKLEVWYDNTTQSIVYSLWYNRDTETHPTSEVHYIHYAHMWPGSIAYKHVQEDKAIALMRVRQYVFVTVQKKLVAKAGTAHLEGFDFPIAMKATPIYDVIAFEATNGTDKRSELLGISCTSRGVSYMTLQSPTQEEYQYTILFSCEQLG